MAERRKSKKKKDPIEIIEEKPLTKEEYAVAKYLKATLPEKKTSLQGHKVEYFIASKAIDCLLDSKWAKNDKKSEIYFHSRDSVVKFMNRLLVHKLFHRAQKIVVIKEQKVKKEDEEESSKEKDKEKTKEKEKVKEKDKDKTKEKEKEKIKEKEKEKPKDKDKEKTKEKEKEKEEKEKEEPKEKKVKTKGKKDSSEKKKEVKKIKLDMHHIQVFVDKNEPYVWIYDPIPLKTWITGALMVLAAVLISCFPLWPLTIRHYIWYLSVAAAFFLVFIIGLAVFRVIIFVLVWLVTFGRHHIWILPNLTEDVGFFESFWPLYKYEYKGRSKDDTEKKPSDEEPESEPKEKESGDKSDESSSDNEKKKPANNSDSEESGDDKEMEKEENGFEMINADDVSHSDEEDQEDSKSK